MTRTILVLLVGVSAAFITYVASLGNVWLTGAVGTVSALMTASVAFTKTILEIRKLFYEGEEKKRSLSDRDRRIVTPSEKQIREFGTPFRTVDRDFLKDYFRYKDPLPPPKHFVESSQETKIGEDAP